MSMFNEEQTAYMAYLATIAPEEKCWCGWSLFGECSNCRTSAPGKTNADRMETLRMKLPCMDCGTAHIQTEACPRMSDTPKTDVEVERLRRLRYHETPETIPHVEASFARELERELSRSLERESKAHEALSLARQYVAAEFGFDNWRIEKIDTMFKPKS